MFTLNLIEIYVVVIDLERVEGQTKTQMQRTYSSIQFLFIYVQSQ
jgi:hypothetical protein